MKDEILKLDRLLKKIVAYSPDANISLISKAYHFTEEAHCQQLRKEGKPYFDHPFSVALILADMHMDCKTIVAGFLHDTVEDTETTVVDIEEIFGEDVAFMVKSLTKLKAMEFKTREETQAENFRRMFIAMAEDVRVVLIKFADRLHNMRTLEFMPDAKQKTIAAETLDIYAPLANRLGMGWLKSEFEDLGFKYLHPELYEELYKKVEAKKELREAFIRNLAATIEDKAEQHTIPARVSGRVKNLFGIFQKMQTQRISFEEVNDVLGLRIVTLTKAHCYMILGLIHSLWVPVPGRFKDYVAMPKSNMYQSLHTTVLGPNGERVEFQIRTEEMHLIAEKGIAAHWLYKEKEKEKKIDEKDSTYMDWLKSMVHLQRDSDDAREFLEMFKGEVLSDVVFVFTPAGDIKELQVGSTPVDFAYAIHTQVGNKCSGARVNGRIVPLKYQLQNGDTIEILTSPSHTPNRDWLTFAVTHKAKNRIRHWIKTEQMKQGVVLGSNLLESAFIKNGIKVSTLKSKKMQEITESFNFKTVDELLYSVGFGKITPKQVVQRISPETKEETSFIPKIHKPTTKQGGGIHITGIDNLLYATAKCCYPVPGDKIIGFITKGKGVTIHRQECHNSQRLSLDEARLVTLTWNSETTSTTTARIYVETIDKPGILASLSNVISTFNINLSHLEAKTAQDKHAHFTFTLEVSDKTQLTNLTNKILSSDGVIKVSR
ncbi:RelA/SpoT family protein [Candidatus Magnetomonas plexicatena]|uniref:RelA/SpoT family protein n=1 Tax=Candidatus Magnetomonas plexicatena TaxID=2552947 RepID=UPI0040329C28